MKALCLVCALFAALACGAVQAGETVTVPGWTPDGAWSSTLLAGQSYVMTASGTYHFHSVRYADAEWMESDDGNWYEYHPAPGGWSETKDIEDILIDGTSVSWMGSSDGVSWAAHTFSPNHIYRYYLTGTGQPVRFQIADAAPLTPDNWFADNSGSLTVEITPLPEPSSILALLCGLSGAGGLLIRNRRHSEV